MKIRFSEIPDEGLVFEINDRAWFPDRDIKSVGPIHSRIQLQKKGRDRILLTGELETIISLECDRCLETFTRSMSGEFRIDLELLDEGGRQPLEHGCTLNEMDTLYIRQPEIDLFEVLNQQAYLFLPEKRICNDDCRGLCPRCGANLNKEKCRCQPEAKSSPFQVLAGMKRK